MRELRDGGRDLQALVEDDLLALKANILGPLDEAGQVGLGADVLAYVQIMINESYARGLHNDRPMPKFFGVDSKSGFLTVLVALLANGAAAGFLPLVDLGGWSLRRGTSAAALRKWKAMRPQCTRSSNVYKTAGAESDQRMQTQHPFHRVITRGRAQREWSLGNYTLLRDV